MIVNGFTGASTAIARGPEALGRAPSDRQARVSRAQRRHSPPGPVRTSQDYLVNLISMASVANGEIAHPVWPNAICAKMLTPGRALLLGIGSGNLE